MACNDHHFLNTDIKLPPEEERQLIALMPVPSWHGVEPKKMARNYADMRGPELVNNDLIHGQFGVMVNSKSQSMQHLSILAFSFTGPHRSEFDY